MFFFYTGKVFDRVNIGYVLTSCCVDVRLLTSCNCLRHGMNRRNFMYCGEGVLQKVNVTNGVRQGGILPTYLFNVYTDGLPVALDRSGVGCRYLGSINHLCYAGDMVLLSPTSQGLQKNAEHLRCLC